MSNLQTDTIQTSDPIVDTRKIDPVKTPLDFDQFMRLLTQHDWSQILFNTKVMGAAEHGTTWVLKDTINLPSGTIAGAQLWSFQVSWPNIKRYTNIETLFDKNHAYVNLIFLVQIELKGGPRYWGKTVTTFNPDPDFTFGQGTGYRYQVEQGYNQLKHVNWFAPMIQAVWKDSKEYMIIPFHIPMDSLRNLVIDNKRHRNWVEGMIDIRCFTPIRSQDAESSPPLINIHFSVAVAYGGSEYSSTWGITDVTAFTDPTDRTNYTLYSKQVFN